MTHPVPVACAAWLSAEFWEDALRPAPWIVVEAWLTLHRVSRAAGVPSAVVAQARGQLEALLRAGLWGGARCPLANADGRYCVRARSADRWR